MKEILNIAVDLFSDFSFEVESLNNVKTLRIKLKKYTLEQNEISALFKIHPFRIHLAPHNDPAGFKLNLFFDFSENTLNNDIKRTFEHIIIKASKVQ